MHGRTLLYVMWALLLGTGWVWMLLEMRERYL